MTRVLAIFMLLVAVAFNTTVDSQTRRSVLALAGCAAGGVNGCRVPRMDINSGDATPPLRTHDIVRSANVVAVYSAEDVDAQLAKRDESLKLHSTNITSLTAAVTSLQQTTVSRIDEALKTTPIAADQLQRIVTQAASQVSAEFNERIELLEAENARLRQRVSALEERR